MLPDSHDRFLLTPPLSQGQFLNELIPNYNIICWERVGRRIPVVGAAVEGEDKIGKVL